MGPEKSRPKVLAGTRRGWATTAWTLQDIYHLADEKGLHLTRDQAKALLDEAECGLEEAMIKSGWNFLEGAFDTFCQEKGIKPDGR